jgi:hypothetical protein
VYPEYPWDQKRFRIKPHKYWKSKENRRIELDQVLRSLNIHSLDDCYNLTQKSIVQHGGAQILSTYRYNHFKMFSSLYPHHPWDPLKMKTRKDWEKKPISLSLLMQLQSIYDIRCKEDWYHLSSNLINQQFYASGYTKRGGLFTLLSRHYPEIPWDPSQFSQPGKKSTQRWLFISIRKLFPNFVVLFDYDFPSFLFPSGYRMQLDVFVPSLFLGLEYHGAQHYEDCVATFNPMESYISRDLQKLKLCSSRNLHLVVIPYWWDGSSSSLFKQLRLHFRPTKVSIHHQFFIT